MLKLRMFNISHFSEKVRWALDYEADSLTLRIRRPHVTNANLEERCSGDVKVSTR